MPTNRTDIIADHNGTHSEPAPEVWPDIRDALRGLQYGTVVITVQDGIIVQIDRTEKRRLRWLRNKST